MYEFKEVFMEILLWSWMVNNVHWFIVVGFSLGVLAFFAEKMGVGR